MTDGAGKTFLVICGLVLVWILTYWWWDPSDDRPQITFAPPAAVVTTDEGVGAVLPSPSEPTGPVGPVLPQSVPEREAVADPEPREAAPAERPATRVIAPEFREITVRSGDTFERIAHRELGQSSLWTVIAEANPLKDPRRIRPGDTLRVPVDPNNTQGIVVTEDYPTPVATEGNDEIARGIEYTVRSGDTLSGIARTYYGSAGFDDFIFHHNRETLASKDALRVGQVLLLPPAPGG